MSPTRRTAAIAIVAIATAACANVPGLPEEPAEIPTETVVAGQATTPTGPVTGTSSGTVSAADPVDATDGASPAASPSPDGTDPAAQAPSAPAEPLPASVEVLQPDYVVTADAGLDDEVLGAVAGLPSVQHVAPMGRTEARLSGPEQDRDDTIAAVAPSALRPLTPEVTAQAVGVWERLAAGDVVVRHDVANELGIELGGNLLLATDTGSRVVRVGAFASNGTPPVAAVLVPWSVGQELGIERPNSLVVAASDDQDDQARSAISELLPNAEVARRRPPEQQTASAGGSSRLEPFNYTDIGDGTIVIDPNWVAEHIRTVEIPGIATTRCHQLMIPQLLAALEEIRAAGLYGHFKPEQFGGCWVARHIDWDPSKPLSNHAWGIAIDFNTHDNWLGEEPQMDRRIVEIFERWGFEWGGHWSRPDGMHFELDRIVRPAS